MKDYISIVTEQGFHTVSSTPKQAANFASKFNQHLKQSNVFLASLKKDKVRSPLEKHQLAEKERAKAKRIFEQSIQFTLDNLKDQHEAIDLETRKTLKSDYSQEVSAMYGLQLSQLPTDKLNASLGDKNVLAALSGMPSALSPISNDLLEQARSQYVAKHRPDIVKAKEELQATNKYCGDALQVAARIDKEYAAFKPAGFETLANETSNTDEA